MVGKPDDGSVRKVNLLRWQRMVAPVSSTSITASCCAGRQVEQR